MKITENSKIRILSPEHSEYVQKIAFESGLSWGITRAKIAKNTDAKFLFFHPSESEYLITYSDSEECFISEKSKEIFIPMPDDTDSFLKSIPKIGVEYELKPYWNKVRVDAVVDLPNELRIIYWDYKDCSYGYANRYDYFRPIETEEQKAARKRDKLADEICGRIVLHYGNPKGAESYINVSKHLADWLIQTNRLKEDE